MWYKNFRTKKVQVALLAVIILLCTTFIGTAANILTLLSVPYDTLAEECDLPEARCYLSGRSVEEVQAAADQFEKLSMVKNVKIHPYLVAASGIEYQGETADMFAVVLEYDEETFGKVRIVEGEREALQNLSENECFLPFFMANDADITIGDTITVRCNGSDALKYTVKGFFSDIFSANPAYDSELFVGKLPEEVSEADLNYMITVRTDEAGQLESSYRKQNDGILPGNIETAMQRKQDIQISNDILGGLFLGVGAICFLTSCLIIYFLIKNMLQRDAKKIAVFKMIGYGTRDIIRLYFYFYLLLFGISAAAGVFFSAELGAVLLNSTLQNIGVKSAARCSGLAALLIVLIIALASGQIALQLYSMRNIPPIYAMNGMTEGNTRKGKNSYQGSFSPFGMAMRSICREKKGVTTILMTAIVVAFISNFAMISLNVVQMQKESNCFWLAVEDCEVVMNSMTMEAFEETDDFLAADEDVEKVVRCMRNCYVNLHWEEGMDHTSVFTNVYETLQDTDLTLCEGREPEADTELAIGIKVAESLGKKVGDYVTLDSADGGTRDYLICGSFQSYVEMGNCMRMTKEGIERLGQDCQYNYHMVYLKEGVSAEAFIEKTKGCLPDVVVQERQQLYGSILNDMIVEPQEMAIPPMMVLVFLIAGVSIFSMVMLKNNADKKNDEIYKCIGYRFSHLILAKVSYVFLIALLGVAVALPLCYFSYPRIMIYSLSFFGMAQYPIVYDWDYMLVANSGVIVVFLVAALLSSLSLRKTDVRNLVQE